MNFILFLRLLPLRLLPFVVVVAFTPLGRAQSLKELNDAAHTYMTGGMDSPSFKSKADAILAAENEPSRKAELLYALLKRLCNNLAGKEDLVIFYSEQALGLPLSSGHRAQVLVHQANAFEFKAAADHEHERQFTLVALKPYLTGLNLCITEQKQKEVQPLPAVDMYDIAGAKNDPKVLEAQAQNEKQLAARAFIMEQNQLIDLRRSIEGRIKQLFKVSQLSEVERTNAITDTVVNPEAKQYILEHLIP